MSKRAEEKAVEYQIKTHGPNVMGGASILSEDEYMRLNMNYDFKAGYEQAEKETIERAVAWLEENVWGHTVLDHTELSNAFRQAMGQEPKNYRIRIKDEFEV